MKKLVSIVLVLVLAALMLPIAISADTTPTTGEIKVAYVDGVNGSRDYDGLTVKSAVNSLKQAFQVLGNEGGIICFVGDTVIDDPEVTEDERTVAGWNMDMPLHTGKVFITAINDAKLIKNYAASGTTISFNGPVEFYNITFDIRTAQNLNLYCYANNFTFGKGVVCTIIEGAGSKGVNIHGYTANSESGGLTGDPVINIYSGTIKQINAAGTQSAKTLTGNATINIYGGTVNKVNGAGAGGHDGDTTINIYKGAEVLEVTQPSDTEDQTTGAKNLNLYNYSAAETIATIHELYTVMKPTGTVPVADSDLITFTVVEGETPVTTARVTTATPTTANVTTQNPGNATTPVVPTTTQAPAVTTADPDEGKGCSGFAMAAQLIAVLCSGAAFIVIKKH